MYWNFFKYTETFVSHALHFSPQIFFVIMHFSLTLPALSYSIFPRDAFRLDDDCNSQEICQGVTCVLGCRSSSSCPLGAACINNQCADPCAASTAACGTNALCSVVNHEAVCACPAGLSGDPRRACGHPVVACAGKGGAAECRAGFKCVGGACASSCETSNDDCLSNEVSFFSAATYRYIGFFVVLTEFCVFCK